MSLPRLAALALLASLSPPLAAIAAQPPATPLLLPHVGWRGMFLIGLIPGLVAFGIRWYVGEPKIFLESQKAARGTTPLKMLVKDGATTKVSLGMLILCGVQNFGYYGIMIWLPTYLGKTLGFSLTKSALWTSVTILGMMAGIVVFGHLADRIGRKPTFLIFQAGAVAMVLTYAQLTDPVTMLWAGALMGMFVNGMIGGYGALISEAYPTAARATAQNVLFNTIDALIGDPLIANAFGANTGSGATAKILDTVVDASGAVSVAATAARSPPRPAAVSQSNQDMGAAAAKTFVCRVP